MQPRSHLQFCSTAEFLPGKDAAPAGSEIIQLLAQGMGARGITVCDPVQEDWGWNFYARLRGIRFVVGCGAYAEFENGWLTFAEPTGLHWKRWFGRADFERASGEVADVMLDVVSGDGRFFDLAWWTDRDGLGATIPAGAAG